MIFYDAVLKDTLKYASYPKIRSKYSKIKIRDKTAIRGKIEFCWTSEVYEISVIVLKP